MIQRPTRQEPVISETGTVALFCLYAVLIVFLVEYSSKDNEIKIRTYVEKHKCVNLGGRGQPNQTFYYCNYRFLTKHDILKEKD